MKVRAKFQASSIESFVGTSKKARLNAITAYSCSPSEASEEDKAFWEATPSGQMELYISNPNTADFFVPGQRYYVTFEQADA